METILQEYCVQFGWAVTHTLAMALGTVIMGGCFALLQSPHDRVLHWNIPKAIVFSAMILGLAYVISQ